MSNFLKWDGNSELIVNVKSGMNILLENQSGMLMEVTDFSFKRILCDGELSLAVESESGNELVIKGALEQSQITDLSGFTFSNGFSSVQRDCFFLIPMKILMWNTKP